MAPGHGPSLKLMPERLLDALWLQATEALAGSFHVLIESEGFPFGGRMIQMLAGVEASI